MTSARIPGPRWGSWGGFTRVTRSSRSTASTGRPWTRPWGP